MRLLDEIVGGATSSGTPVADLLRQCLVLAYRLKNARLKEWCKAELDGYPDGSELPEYRKGVAHSYGLMVGPFGARIDRQPLALGLVEEKHRSFLMEICWQEPIAQLEAMLKIESDEIVAAWPADLVAYYQSRFIKGFALNRAWKSIPKNAIVAICDVVRSRILLFALELSEEVGDAESPLERISGREVEAKVTNIIFGGQNIIGSQVAGSVHQAGGET